jgi:hypothetical protein
LILLALEEILAALAAAVAVGCALLVLPELRRR